MTRLAGLTEREVDDRVTENTIQGIWDFEPADVLDVLLLHSDCKYSIPHRFCVPLADRLANLIALDIEGDPYFIQLTTQFVAGLRNADECGEDISFR